jgi:fructose-bisphosphate aldolase class II
MPLIPMRPILEATEKYQYAQGAFNVMLLRKRRLLLKFMRCFVLRPSFKVQTWLMPSWAAELIL